MSNLPAVAAWAARRASFKEGVSTMPSSSRSALLPLALAIAVGVLIAASPLSAQVDPIEPSDYSGGPGVGPIGPPVPGENLTSGPTSLSSKSGGSADPFFLIQKTIVMSHEDETLPMPDYEQVDVEGTFQNAPGSVACGGTVSEGAAEDADDCQLLYQLTFQNGYLKANGTITTPNATKYNGQTSMLVWGHVGDVVQLTVQNEQPEAINGEAIDTGFFAPADNKQIVHWHGMELDNESDGTPVAEFGIETGEQRLYQYRLYRPGIYWFHPHILPLLTESRGMVGRLVIRSYEEDFLSLVGVLPLAQYVFQLDDSTIANDFNKDAYRNGVLFADFYSPEEVENHLMPDIRPDLNGDGVCDRGPGDCIVKEGEYVFVNGVMPTSDENVPTIYVPEGRGARVGFINSSTERFYRFRLLLEGEEPPGASGTPVPAERVNRPTTGQCYAPGSSVQFSGGDPLSCDQGLVMYRVGGENGLLDYARIEGQSEIPPADPFVPRDFDTVIRRGEDFIGVSERTEFVVVTKDREGNYLEPGESMYIWNIDYPHGIFTPKFDNNIGDGDANNRDIAPRKLVRIKIVPNLLGLPPYDIAEGDPLMAHPWVNRPAEDIRSVAIDQLSPVPVGLDPHLGVAFEGLEHGTIMLGNQVNNGSRFPSINSIKGDYGGFPASGTDIPTQGATRYARTENVIEFVYANNTGNAHHPFHHHGFSFQPISIHNFESVDSNGDGVDDTVVLEEPPVYTFDYNEFLDVEAMQPGKALKYRMKMNDRFKIPDETKYSWAQLLQNFPYDYQGTFGGDGDIDNPNAVMGGAVGRWLFHCHILHHARLGMISDLCIAPSGDPDASACKIDIDQGIYQPIL
jgi:FtsP/CotA-like multicopper oxidase with cupredoxin domain